MFAQDHPDVPQRFWKNVLWTVKTQDELFWQKCTMLGLKEEGHCTPTPNPLLQLWRMAEEHHGSVAASHLRMWTFCNEGTINSKEYQDILQENIRATVHGFKLGWCNKTVNQNSQVNHLKKWLKMCFPESAIQFRYCASNGCTKTFPKCFIKLKQILWRRMVGHYKQLQKMHWIFCR